MVSQQDILAEKFDMLLMRFTDIFACIAEHVVNGGAEYNSAAWNLHSDCRT